MPGSGKPAVLLVFAGKKCRHKCSFMHYRMLKYFRIGDRLSRLMRAREHLLEESDLSHIILFQTKVKTAAIQDNY